MIVGLMLIALTSDAQEAKEIFKKKELDLDSSFTNSTIRFRPKMSSTVSNKKMTKVSFGSFELVQAVKDKGQIIDTKKSKEIFNKYYSSKSSRRASLTILVAEKDTVLVDLFFETTSFTTSQTAFGRMVFGENEDRHEHWAKCSGMMIKLPGDTVLWHFIPAYKRPTPNDTIYNEYGKLISTTDSIEIKYTIGYKGFKKLGAGYATGIVFNYDNKPVAARQFGYKDYVWLSANESDKHRTLIGTCILALLCVGGEELRY